MPYTILSEQNNSICFTQERLRTQQLLSPGCTGGLGTPRGCWPSAYIGNQKRLDWVKVEEGSRSGIDGADEPTNWVDELASETQRQ